MSRPLPRRRRPRTVLGVLGALTLLVSLAACTSDGTEERDPADALSAAADRLSATSGVRLELLTDDLPSGISGLTGAEGVASGDAFEGELSVRISMATFEVPVVSLDDTVWAVLPGARIRICRPRCRDVVPRHETGELHVGGEAVIAQYFEAEDASFYDDGLKFWSKVKQLVGRLCGPQSTKVTTYVVRLNIAFAKWVL